MPRANGVCPDLFPRHGIAVRVETDYLIELAPTRSHTAVTTMAAYLIPFMIIGAVPAPAAATNKSQSAPCLIKFRAGLRKQAQRPENTRRLFVAHGPIRAETDVDGGALN